MRYLARRIASGEWIDADFTLTDVESTTTLSGPGIINGNLAPEVNRALWPDRLRVAEDWATMIFQTDDNGDFVNHGIVLPPTSYEDTARISCAGVTSYPQGYVFTGSKMYGPQLAQPAVRNKNGKTTKAAVPFMAHPDPIEMWREHWAWIQAQQDSNLGVVITGTPNTGKRPGGVEPVVGLGTYEEPYRLRYYETPDLGSEMDSLATLTPFDFRERVRWQGNDPRIEVEVGYPRLGRRRDDLRFVQGENIMLPTVQTIAGGANMLIGVGNGDPGPSMAYTEMAWVDGRLRRHRIITDKTATEATLKRRLAIHQTALSTQRYDVTSVAIWDHPNAPLSRLELGDDIRVQAEHPEFGVVDLWVRILSITRGDDESVAVLTTSASAFFIYSATEAIS